MKSLVNKVIVILFLCIPVFAISQENNLLRDDHQPTFSKTQKGGDRDITQWTGNTSTDWDDFLNWDNGVPDVSRDAEILSGCTYYPVLTGHLGVDTVSASIPYACASLLIEPGAMLTIDAANADLISQGTINLEGTLHVADDILLFDGSVLNITHENAMTRCGLRSGYYGKTFLYEGSVLAHDDGEFYTEELQLDNGCQYSAISGTMHIYVSGSVPPTQDITINDPDSYFWEFNIENGANAALTNCDYDLDVYALGINQSSFQLTDDTINCAGVTLSGGSPTTFTMNGGEMNISVCIYLNSGTHFEMTDGTVNCEGYWGGISTSTVTMSGGEMFVRENFLSHNHGFQASGGSVTLYGDDHTDIDGTPTFYNLIIDKDAGYEVVMFIDTLIVANNLTIEGGTLNPVNQPVYVGGNWTNNAGDGGFLEGNCKVTLNGSVRSDILTNETFHELILNKTSAAYDALELAEGITVTVTDDLRILDGCLEMNNNSSLLVGDTLFIELNAGLNANSDVGLSIGAGGDWINNNTFYNTSGIGFAPGTSEVVFSGDANATIHYSGDVESFYNVVLNKPGDTLFYTDSIAFNGSFSIQNGVFRGDFTPTRLYSDLIIAGSGKWHGGKLIFSGDADQSVTLGGFSLFGEMIVDKQAVTDGPLDDGLAEMITGVYHACDPGRGGERSQSVTLNSNLWISGDEDLVVDEGTLQCADIDLRVSGGIEVNDGGELIMDPGSTIYLNDKFTVNNGGVLELLGTEADSITITNWHGSFLEGLNVRNGGTLTVAYTSFENMTDSAVYIHNGAIIDPVNAFNHCSFSGFDTGTTFMTINTGQVLSVTGVDFGDDPGGGSYNAGKTINQGLLYFSEISGSFAGPYHEDDFYSRIEWTDAGTWTGAANSDWYKAANWLFEILPTPDSSVVIPGGCPNYPVITTSAGCENLEVQAGAVFTVNSTFTVGGDLTVAGEIILDNDATSVLNIDGNVSWQSGSQCTKDWSSIINISGDWTFEAGSDVQLTGAGIHFNSSGSQQIMSHESSSSFHTLYCQAADTLFFSDLSTDTTCLGNLVVVSGTVVHNNSLMPICFEYSLNNAGGHFYAPEGTCIFSGTSGEIVVQSGDYFNDLTINTINTCTITDFYNDTLKIMGDLVIETPGGRGTVFDPDDNVIVVYGDWDNLVGETGFDEGTGTVIFKGGSPSVLQTEETFYDLIINKTFTAYNGFSTGPDNYLGVDLTILNDLSILDGTMELNSPCTLTIGNDLFIALNAGLNANDTDFDIYIAGDWTNNNPTASSTLGFEHLGYGTVIFNGNSGVPQNIYQLTSFNNLTVNRPVLGRVRPLGNALYASHINVIAGILRTGGAKIEVENDITIQGILEMETSSQDSLVVHGNIIWQNGSEAQTSFGGMKIFGNWYFEDGCDVLTDPGCEVRMSGQNASYIYCQDETSAIGTLILDKDTASAPWTFLAGTNIYDLHVTGDLILQEGNELRVQGRELLVNGTCLVDTAALISMNSPTGIVQLDSTLTLIGHLDIDEGTVIMHGMPYFEAPGILTIDGGSFICDATDFPGDPFIDLYGTFNFSEGLFESTEKAIQFRDSGINNISGGVIRSHSGFFARSGSNFQPTGGEVECAGPHNALIRADAPCHLHNLTIAPDPLFYRYLESDLTIKGTLALDSGSLHANGYDILLQGHWLNSAGESAYVAGGGKVIMTGITLSTINGRNIFYHLEDTKTLGGSVNFVNHSTINDSLKVDHIAIIVDTVMVNNMLYLDNPDALLYISANGSCETEYLDQGGNLNVSGGTFIAYDIVELMGLEGEYVLGGNGSITIVQDLAGYCDILADISISSGYFVMAGGHDRSYWPGTGTTHTVEISGGTFDFSSVGIFLRTGLTANISGGHIRTFGDLTCMDGMNTFQPTGGIFELYGNDITTAQLETGSWLYDMWVNKTGSVNMWLDSDLQVKNELRIMSGKMRTYGYTVTVGN